ncbi:MAG: hypothetical protein Q4G63_02390 [Bacteroidia bacterium]|nr:hypothetical protein [Bacteroidia bacterium]
MALDNNISIEFTAEEVAQMREAIKTINTVLQGKAINLTPDERRQYGSIADRNKVLVDKAKFYMESMPETLPRTIDKEEFDRDYVARQQLEAPLRELAAVMEKMSDTKTLLDFDNFQATLAYYRYVKYLAGQNEPGTTSIYQDMSLHYKGGRPAAEKAPESTPPTAAE